MITYHPEIVQGTDEWYALRCGMLTASEMKLIITPATLKAASNDKERAHLYELLGQRITGHVEPAYVSDDMLRGQEDEIEACAIYNEKIAPVSNVGFVTNSDFGFSIGCSPDGLVGDDGLIECKSRRQKYQIETFTEHLPNGTIPDDYLIQVQTALLVSGRNWCDFITYCGGLHMAVIRVLPDQKIQSAIIAAASIFEKKLSEKLDKYNAVVNSYARLFPTKRRVEQEMII